MRRLQRASLACWSAVVLHLMLSGFLIADDCADTGWVSVTSGVTNNLRDVHFVNAKEGWAVGDGGVFLHTTSGGCGWSKIDLGSYKSESLHSVRFFGGGIGWIAGRAWTLRMTDAGSTVDRPLRTSMDVQNCVFPVSQTVAWGAGYSAGASPFDTAFSRYICSGGGTQQSNYQQYPPESSLLGTCFPNLDSGWAVGTNGCIVRITGASGESPNFAAQTIPGVTFESVRVTYDSGSSRYTGWAVGQSGVIDHTDDGQVWQPQQSGTNRDLHHVCALNASRAWAVGSGGVILSTTNGGQTWNDEASGTGNDLFGIFFVNAGFGIAVGEKGTILIKSMNTKPVISGMTSASSNPGKPAVIKGCGFADSAGGNEVCFRTTKAQITKVGKGTLTVTIPSAMKPGLVGVYVKVDGQKSNTYKFQIK